MFSVPDIGIPLTQGDILDECPLISLRSEGSLGDLQSLPVQRWTSRVIVLTQACDLAQIKTGIVLVAPVLDAQKLVDRGVIKGATIRDHVRRHQVFGWYF